MTGPLPFLRIASVPVALVVVSTACTSGTSSEPPATEGSTTTQETEFVPGDFVPYAFGIRSLSFGYDPALNQAFPIDIATESGSVVSQPIELHVHLVNQSVVEGAALDASNHCIITLRRHNPVDIAPWVAETGAWFAIEASGWEHVHNCGDLGFSSSWGPYPPKHILKWTWGAGLGAVTPDAIEIMGTDWALFEPWVIGGGYYWERLPDLVTGTQSTELFDSDGYVDAGIAYAYQLTAEGQLATTPSGDPLLLPASSQPADGPPVRAWYDVQVGRYLVPAARLLQSPDEPDTGL